MPDLNLAWLAAQPIFETGLSAHESFYRSLRGTDRERPSVGRMLLAIRNVRNAMRAGSFDQVIQAFGELASAYHACGADGLPGCDIEISFPGSAAEDEPGQG